MSPKSCTKSDYLSAVIVNEFVDYLSELLPRWKVSYVSQHRRLKHRHIEIHGVEQAIEKYAWPAEFICPEDVDTPGGRLPAGSKVSSYDWPTTKASLALLRGQLRRTIIHRKNASVIAWSDCILKWGMGPRGKSAKDHLRQVRGGAVSDYLADVDRAVAEEDLTKITSHVVPKFNSGLSKIHSLASEKSTLVIFDSRVALALGTAINVFLASQKQASIPEYLSIGRALDRTPAVTVGGDNQPILSRDYTWLQAQMKVSWLLEAALKKNQIIFEGSLPHRLHCLEAALFMIGTQPLAVKQGLERSFV